MNIAIKLLWLDRVKLMCVYNAGVLKYPPKKAAVIFCIKFTNNLAILYLLGYSEMEVRKAQRKGNSCAA